MGDFHFVLRHALTGGVLILFMLNGLVIFHYDLAVLFFVWLSNDNTHITSFSTIIGLAASAPIIGVGIQGAQMTWLMATKGIFTDEARRQAARHVQQLISKQSLPQLSGGEIRDLTSTFHRMPEDSIFVWLYHTGCPVHLIEWARRRRSYCYLGYNWAAAGVIGLILGGFIHKFINEQAIVNTATTGHFTQLNRTDIQVLVGILSTCWIWGAIYLGSIMKRDVDTMELAWIYGKLHPVLESLVARKAQ